MKGIRLTYRPSNTLLAEGPIGWGITPFEGNFYVRRKYLSTNGFRANLLPGLCVYKFLYVWLDLHLRTRQKPRLALLVAQSPVPVHLVQGRTPWFPPRYRCGAGRMATGIGPRRSTTTRSGLCL